MILALSIIENDYFRNLGQELCMLYSLDHNNRLALCFDELSGRCYYLHEKDIFKNNLEKFASQVVPLME